MTYGKRNSTKCPMIVVMRKIMSTISSNLDKGDDCINALINNALKKKEGDTVHRQSACINLDAEYKTKKEKEMTVKRSE